MSECVVRMDHIPRNCLECPLNGQCGIFADWVCTLNSPARKHYPQPFDKGCNILAVLPENHGRLVDADAMADDVRILWDYKTVDGITASTVLKQIITDIGNCPTIVPAEGSE